MPARPRARVAFKGHLITVRLTPVTLPDGSTARFELVEHPDAAAIVAVRNDASDEPLVALVQQERPAIRAVTWEIPAGLTGGDDENDAERTAARELTEETGFIASELRFLHRHYPSPGFMDEAISIYLATGLRAAPGSPAPDPHEISALRWVPLAEAMAMCWRGEIVDGKTVIGLWLARDALKGQ